MQIVTPKTAARFAKRLPYYFMFLVLTLVFAYGTARDQFGYRWSGWAFGDAQALFASERFAEQGILTNYALPSYAPNTQLGNTYEPYTHYPQLINIPFLTLLRHVGISAPRTLKALHDAISVAFLLIIFYFLRTQIPPWAALIGTVYIATSVVFLDFMDSFVQIYDEIFRAVFLLSIVLFAREKAGDSAVSYRPTILLLIAFLSALLQSMNSYECIFGLQIFGFSYLWLRRRLTTKTGAILLSAPAIGLSLHFGQVVLYEGFRNFWHDNVQELGFRTYNHFGLTARYVFGTFGSGLKASYGPTWLSFGLLVLLFLVAVRFGIDERKQRANLVLVAGVLLGSDIAWYVAFPHSTLNFLVYMTKHLFPFLALIVGATTYYLSRGLLLAAERRKWSAAAITAAALAVLCRAVLVPTAANSEKYLALYPNLVEPRTYPLGVPTHDWISDLTFCKKVAALATPTHQLVIVETQNLHSYTSPPGEIRSPSALLDYYCRGIIISISGPSVLPSVLNDLARRIKAPADIMLASSSHNSIFFHANIIATYPQFGGGWHVDKIGMTADVLN